MEVTVEDVVSAYYLEGGGREEDLLVLSRRLFNFSILLRIGLYLF